MIIYSLELYLLESINIIGIPVVFFDEASEGIHMANQNTINSFTPEQIRELSEAVVEVSGSDLSEEESNELSKTPDITKAEVARKMYELIEDEDRSIVAMAFVEGANLTPKGAMTYVYNVRRQLRKKQS